MAHREEAQGRQPVEVDGDIGHFCETSQTVKKKKNGGIDGDELFSDL